MNWILAPMEAASFFSRWTLAQAKKDIADSGIKLLKKLILVFFFLSKEFHDEIPTEKQAKN